MNCVYNEAADSRKGFRHENVHATVSTAAATSSTPGALPPFAQTKHDGAINVLAYRDLRASTRCGERLGQCRPVRLVHIDVAHATKKWQILLEAFVRK
jgi:hypothetical protein